MLKKYQVGNLSRAEPCGGPSTDHPTLKVIWNSHRPNSVYLADSDPTISLWDYIVKMTKCKLCCGSSFTGRRLWPAIIWWSFAKQLCSTYLLHGRASAPLRHLHCPKWSDPCQGALQTHWYGLPPKSKCRIFECGWSSAGFHAPSSLSFLLPPDGCHPRETYIPRPTLL